MENPTTKTTTNIETEQVNNSKENVNKKGYDTKPTLILPYAEANGLSVIPLGVGMNGKKPAISNLKRFLKEKFVDKERLKNHKGNFGIPTGDPSGDLLVIDFDNKGTAKQMVNIPSAIAHTYVVQTGRGYHLYFFIERGITSFSITMYDSQKVTKEGKFEYAETITFKCNPGYVVAAHSLHYNKDTGVVDGAYIPLNNLKPRTIRMAEFEGIVEDIHEYMRKKGYVEHDHIPDLKKDKNNNIKGLPTIKSLINMSKFKLMANGNYKGPHPFHPSTTQQDFEFDPEAQRWFCFNHWCGGYILSFLAMKYGLCDCSDFEKGANPLKGDIWKELVVRVKEEFGVDISSQKQPEVTWYYPQEGEEKESQGVRIRIEGKKAQYQFFNNLVTLPWINFNPETKTGQSNIKAKIVKVFAATKDEGEKYKNEVILLAQGLLEDSKKEQASSEDTPWLVETDEGIKVKPGILAEHLTLTEKIITNSESGVSYLYENGVYIDGRAKLRALIQSLIPVEIMLKKYKLEAESWIIDATGLTPGEIEERKPIGYANVGNGLINLKTFELEPHTPELISFSQVPVKYNPDADCPDFMKFLNEIIDIEDDRKVIQEFFGYTLLDGYPFAKALILYGEGGTGKSTLINILGGVLGSENISTETIQSISENRFRVAELHGKMANLCPDNPGGNLPDSAVFKAITGKDRISAEKKGTNAFHFTNRAKLLFSANELPRPKDASDAFFDRFIIVTFTHKFRGTEKDIKDINKVLVEKESEGILVWMVKGLKRLIKRDRFSYNQTTEEIREEYIRKSNPVNAFFMDCIEEEIEEFLTKDKVYSAYVDYCKKNKLHILRDNYFKPEFEKQSGSIVKGRKRIDKIQVQIWKGIKFNEGEVCRVEKIYPAQQENENAPTPEKHENLANCAGCAGHNPYSHAHIREKGKHNIKVLYKSDLYKKCLFSPKSSGEREFALHSNKSTNKSMLQTEENNRVIVAKILNGQNIAAKNGRIAKSHLLQLCNDVGLTTAEAKTAIEQLRGIVRRPLGEEAYFDFSQKGVD